MILTVGDSFTYGDELENRLNEAWPYLLGRRFNREVLNLGQSNGSNDMIYRVCIEETCKQKFDLVVVAWSLPDRIEYGFDGTLMSFNAHFETHDLVIKWAEQFYKLGYDDEYQHRRWYTNMVALQGYFRGIQQPYLFISISEIYNFDLHKLKFKHLIDAIDQRYAPGWPAWVNDGMISWQGDCPKGPGGHPLALGHERIANKIAEHISNLNLL